MKRLLPLFFLLPLVAHSADPVCPAGKTLQHKLTSTSDFNTATFTASPPANNTVFPTLQSAIDSFNAWAPEGTACNTNRILTDYLKVDVNAPERTLRRDCRVATGGGYQGYVIYNLLAFCEVPPNNPCQNPQKQNQAINVDATSLGAQVDYCLNGCKLRVVKDAHNIHLPGSPADRRTAWGKFVGETCAVGAPQPETSPEKKNVDGTDGACTSDMKSCISREKKNCGYQNGEYRCVTAAQLTPENPCTQTGSGAVFCRADAATPPAPDNGNSGEPATPDRRFDVHDPVLVGSPGGSRIGLNYYSPQTVNNGSNNPGADSNNNGRCEEGEAGSKDCTPLEGGGDCDEGEECGNGNSFKDPAGEYGYDDLNGDIQEARANLNQALIDIRAEALQIFGNGPTGSGSLPCPSAEILGASVSICLSDYEEQLDVIGALVMLGAFILSALVILGGKS